MHRAKLSLFCSQRFIFSFFCCSTSSKLLTENRLTEMLPYWMFAPSSREKREIGFFFIENAKHFFLLCTVFILFSLLHEIIKKLFCSPLWWADASCVSFHSEGSCYLWRLTKYFIHGAEWMFVSSKSGPSPPGMCTRNMYRTCMERLKD